MYPGKRPHRAVFTAPTVEFDEIGNDSGGLASLGAAWVSLAPLSNRWRTYVESSGRSAEITHELSMATPAFSIPVTAKVAIGARSYDVLVRLDVPNSAETVLLVAEKQV